MSPDWLSIDITKIKVSERFLRNKRWLTFCLTFPNLSLKYIVSKNAIKTKVTMLVKEEINTYSFGLLCRVPSSIHKKYSVQNLSEKYGFAVFITYL